MKYFLVFTLSVFIFSCSREISKNTESKSVKVIEEKNMTVKTIAEKDSFVVKTKDTIEVVDWETHK